MGRPKLPSMMNNTLRFRIVPALTALLLLAAGTAGAAHDDPDCARCHQGARTAADDQWARASLERTCLGCHVEPAATAGGPDFHGQGQCLRCHSYHDPGTVTTTAGDILLADLERVDPAHCASCHAADERTANLSEAHRAAGRLYHEQAALLAGQQPSTPCLWCHSDSRATDWQAAAASGRMAFSEHATHPFGMTVQPGRGAPVRRMRQTIDPRIPLPNGRLECVSCHSLSADTKDRLIAFSEPKGLCLGCHELKSSAGSGQVMLASMDRP
jgi:predicted CXXCH cytochrome family protein